jgi:hypothetical protein
MDRSQGWGLPRYAALLAVLAVHVALLAALLSGSHRVDVLSAANQPVELLFLPPPAVPRIRAPNTPPRHVGGDTAIWMATPVLASVSEPTPATAAESDGSGAGVDWKAEARRAVQAFEIRSHRPRSDYTMPGAAAEEHWWPWTRHRPGDQFKTANGDWIVWISADCYQIASAAANAAAPGAAQPQTICQGEVAAPQAQRND